MLNFKNVHIYDGLLKNQYAKDMVTIMLSDFLMHANKDDKNNIDWSNLFADIMHHKGLNDIFIFLEEQLSDARLLGPCAQGRTTRLLQIWRALPS